jgi:hypothetical protein
LRYKLSNYFIVILLLLLVGFYAPLVFFRQNFFGFDHTYYFEPLTRFISDAIRQFRLPLWNPLLHCGMSEIAVPSPGVFYPPNLLFVWLSFGQAFAWFMILHQFVAGCFAMMLIIDLGWGVPSAVCAAVIAAFCGYMFSLTANYTLTATAAWVPLNFWIVRALCHKQERTKTYLFVCLGGLAFFLLIAAGRPELSVAAVLSIAVFVLLQSRSQKINEQMNVADISHSNLVWLFLALFIGLMLSMPVILPSVEWLINSPRAQGLSIKTVFLWSANWYDIVCLVFAQPFGDLTILGSPFLGLAASRAGCTPFLPSPLVGPVAFTLAIWGFTDKSWRARKWVFLVLSLSLLMIIGNNALIFPKLLEHIPFINLFRYPIKLIIIPIFILAVAAARGLYCLAQSSVKNSSLFSVALLWLVSSLVGCCFTVAGLLAKPLPLLNNSAPAQLMLGNSLLLGSFIGLITFALAYLLNKQWISTGLAVMSINVLLLLSLYLPALRYRPPTIASNVYIDHPFVLKEIERITGNKNEVKKQRILLLYKEPLHMPSTYSRPNSSSYNVNYFAYCRDLLIPNTNLDSDQPLTLGYEAAETGDYRKLSSNLMKRVSASWGKAQISSEDNLSLWQFCRATATSWLCSQTFNDKGKIATLADAVHFPVVCENPGMNLRIYKVQNSLPRAFVCQKWSWAASHQDALDSLAGLTEDDFDPESAAIIERLPNEWKDYPVSLPLGYYADGASARTIASLTKYTTPPNAVMTQAGVIYMGRQTPQSVSIVQPPIFLKDSPENISISVNLDKANFLILSDKFYPGWTASVDGLKTPIFKANGCFRAVYVPAGGHLIQFDYEPLSLTVGFYCALVGASLLAWLSLSVLFPHVLLLLKRMAGEVV